MPRVEPPPPPPRRQLDPAVVQPVSGTLIPPPTSTVIPERPRLEFGNPIAYVLARMFAFVLDVVLVAGVITSLAYSLIAINPVTGLPTNTQRGFDATLALGTLVALVYVWAAEASFGTTIGKLAFGLQVYSVRGGPVGLGRALVRMLLRPIDALVIGAVLAVLPGHRRLGDVLAGTVVAHGRMRRFGPLLGWFLVIVVAGLPFILAGVPRTFASLVAFWEFLPGIVARVLLWINRLFALRG
jgi:uncharacterized RDD family membrane protein YckC